jgi:DnaJ-class molecular chaperone
MTQEVLKQALEALEYIDNVYMSVPKLGHEAITSLRQAIKELESQEPVAVYGYCPECGEKGVMRERRPDGNDKCANGHIYQSCKATHPPQRKPMTICGTCHGTGIVKGLHNWATGGTRDQKCWNCYREAAHGIKE